MELFFKYKSRDEAAGKSRMRAIGRGRRGGGEFERTPLPSLFGPSLRPPFFCFVSSPAASSPVCPRPPPSPVARLRLEIEAEEEEAAASGAPAPRTAEDWDLLRLEAGLYSLQMASVVVGHLWEVGHEGIRERIVLLLDQASGT